MQLVTCPITSQSKNFLKKEPRAHDLKRCMSRPPESTGAPQQHFLQEDTLTTKAPVAYTCLITLWVALPNRPRSSAQNRSKHEALISTKLKPNIVSPTQNPDNTGLFSCISYQICLLLELAQGPPAGKLMTSGAAYIGPYVVPFYGVYLVSYKVIPKRNYLGASG